MFGYSQKCNSYSSVTFTIHAEVRRAWAAAPQVVKRGKELGFFLKRTPSHHRVSVVNIHEEGTSVSLAFPYIKTGVFFSVGLQLDLLHRCTLSSRLPMAFQRTGIGGPTSSTSFGLRLQSCGVRSTHCIAIPHSTFCRTGHRI